MAKLYLIHTVNYFQDIVQVARDLELLRFVAQYLAPNCIIDGDVIYRQVVCVRHHKKFVQLLEFHMKRIVSVQVGQIELLPKCQLFLIWQGCLRLVRRLRA